MLKLSQLKEALEPIKQLSLAEDSLTLSGVTIHVRILTPKQDFQVQKLSQQVLVDMQEEEQADRTKILAYLDEFRLLTLSMCIVQINDLDLRGVSYIETEEQLENGTPIKVTKEQAMRNVMSDWNRPMQIAVLDCYNNLVSKIEKETGTQVEGEFSDDQSELEYLRGRVQELERQKEQKQLENSHNVQQQFRTVVEASKTQDTEKDIQESAQKELAKRREQIFPQNSTPPQINPSVQESSNTESSDTLPQENPPEWEARHDEASETSNDSVFFQEQEFPPPPQPTEKKDGIDVYRLPSQTLEAPNPPNQRRRNSPTPSSRNPRFKPSR